MQQWAELCFLSGCPAKTDNNCSDSRSDRTWSMTFVTRRACFIRCCAARSCVHTTSTTCCYFVYFHIQMVVYVSVGFLSISRLLNFPKKQILKCAFVLEAEQTSRHHLHILSSLVLTMRGPVTSPGLFHHIIHLANPLWIPRRGSILLAAQSIISWITNKIQQAVAAFVSPVFWNQQFVIRNTSSLLWGGKYLYLVCYYTIIVFFTWVNRVFVTQVLSYYTTFIRYVTQISCKSGEDGAYFSLNKV